MSIQVWLAFLAATFVLSLSPGSGALAVLNASLERGMRAGWQVVLGLQLALLIQLVIVACGVGALLLASESAFTWLRILGSSYLICLGLFQFRQLLNPVKVSVHLPKQVPSQKLVVHGLLVNLTNPKALLFSCAFIPQFIVPERNLLQQYFIIAITMCLADIVVMGGYGLLASRMQTFFSEPRLVRLRLMLFGAIFVFLGIAMLGVNGH